MGEREIPSSPPEPGNRVTSPPPLRWQRAAESAAAAGLPLPGAQWELGFASPRPLGRRSLARFAPRTGSLRIPPPHCPAPPSAPPALPSAPLAAPWCHSAGGACDVREGRGGGEARGALREREAGLRHLRPPRARAKPPPPPPPLSRLRQSRADGTGPAPLPALRASPAPLLPPGRGALPPLPGCCATRPRSSMSHHTPAVSPPPPPLSLGRPAGGREGGGLGGGRVEGGEGGREGRAEPPCLSPSLPACLEPAWLLGGERSGSSGSPGGRPGGREGAAPRGDWLTRVTPGRPPAAGDKAAGRARMTGEGGWGGRQAAALWRSPPRRDWWGGGRTWGLQSSPGYPQRRSPCPGGRGMSQS